MSEAISPTQYERLEASRVPNMAHDAIIFYNSFIELAWNQRLNQVPTEDELLHIKSQLIDLWKKADIDDFESDIDEVFSPLLKSEDPGRFKTASELFTVLIREKLENFSMTPEEFLENIHDPKIIARFILADMMGSFSYSFLESWDSYYEIYPKGMPTFDLEGHDITLWSCYRSPEDKKPQELAVEEMLQLVIHKDDILHLPSDQLKEIKKLLFGHSLSQFHGLDIPRYLVHFKDFNFVIDELVKEAKMSISAKVLFHEIFEFDYLSELKKYDKWIAGAGLHSKLGKFYRRQRDMYSKMANLIKPEPYIPTQSNQTEDQVETDPSSQNHCKVSYREKLGVG